MVGNVVGGTKILYNNQPIEVLMEACKRSIDTLDEPIWYTCEVNQRFSGDLGFEDIQMYATKIVNFGFRFHRNLHLHRYTSHPSTLPTFHCFRLDIQSLFNTDISIPMTKSDRITYRDSSPTHAMVITGVLVEVCY